MIVSGRDFYLNALAYTVLLSTLPTPSDFMIKGKENLWHLWHCSNFGGNWRERGGPYSRELKQRRFWPTHVNRKLTSCILGQWFCPNFRANRLYKAKINSDTNLFKASHFRLTCGRVDCGHACSLIPLFLNLVKLIFDPSTYASDCLRIKLLSSLPDSHAQRRSGFEIVVKLCLVWSWLPRPQKKRNCSWNDDKQVSPFLSWSLPTSALLWIFSVRCSGFTIAPRNHDLPFGVNFGIFYLVIPNTRILW